MNAVTVEAAVVAAGIALAGVNEIPISCAMAARYMIVAARMIIGVSTGNHVLHLPLHMSCTNTDKVF
jgi:hypothetical protein